MWNVLIFHICNFILYGVRQMIQNLGGLHNKILPVDMFLTLPLILWCSHIYIWMQMCVRYDMSVLVMKMICGVVVSLPFVLITMKNRVKMSTSPSSKRNHIHEAWPPFFMKLGPYPYEQSRVVCNLISFGRDFWLNWPLTYIK